MIEVTRENYVQVAAELKLSYSVLKRLAGVRPEILLNDNACFYDIETEKNRFKIGVVNDRLFTDPSEMLRYIQTFRVACSFNGYRFDNEVLYKQLPSFFKSVDYRSFILHKVSRCINIDLLPVYMLYSPFKGRHRLDDLASELNIKLNIKRKYAGFDEGKCREDVEIIGKFYPVAKDLLNWVEKTFLVDPESLCVLYFMEFGKMRRWFLQSWMLQHGIYPKLIRVDDDRKPSFYVYHKKGLFRNVFVHDVRASYPTTAINLNCSLYREGDFADFEKFLLEQREQNPQIGTFIKFVSNALIGDEGNKDNVLYDKRILVSVWLAFKEVMEKWVKQIGVENIVWGYTDGIMTKLPSVPEVPGYEVQVKARFDWVVIYNQIRYVAKLAGKDEIRRVHFDRKLQIKLFDYLDREIDLKLLSDPVGFVKDPKLDVGLSDFPEDAFKICVFKRNEICKNIKYLMLWPDFQFGLNNVYLGKKGLTQNPEKMCLERYNRFYKYYLGLFKLKGGEIE